MWPTVGIALAAVILAFIIGHVTAGGGGSSSVGTTVTTEASTTTTTAPVLTVTVQRGDTLSAIASKNGISLQTLATYNNIVAPFRVFVGEVIHIPPKNP